MEIVTNLTCSPVECKEAREGRFTGKIACFVQDRNQELKNPGVSHEVSSVEAVHVSCDGLTYPEVRVPSGEQSLIEVCTALIVEATVTLRLKPGS